MEIFVSPHSQVYIVGSNGLRKPDISEVELAQDENRNSLFFEGTITDHKIVKCRCKKDEIILEKTNDETLKISTAYQAPKELYSQIINLAKKGKLRLEISKCENISDLYYLDKIITKYTEKK